MIRPDDLALLDSSDIAAFEARRKWLAQANHPDRKGKQLLPAGDWSILLWRAGRGFGKSLAESHALWWECWEYPGLIAHYLAPTLADVKGTIFEGPAGVCKIVPPECLLKGSIDKAYNKTDHLLTLSNGSVIKGFATTEEGERLRGPQCSVLAGDELAAWDRPAGNLETAFNNAMFGVRMPYPNGRPARAIFGTTPRPIPFLKRLEARRDVIVVRGTSYENLRNLSPSYRNQLLSLAGTQIGKQEIDGDYLGEDDVGILKRNWFKLWPAEKALPEFSFVIECYDTAASEENFDVKKQKTDPTACIVLGIFNVAQVFDEYERKRMGVRSRYAALLCEAWSEWIGFPDLLDRARAQHRVKYGPPGKARRADVTLIEDKSSGRQLRQTMATWGVPCWPFNPVQSKTQRMHAVSPIVKQGMVFVPESMMAERRGMPRDWVEPFLEQVCAFAGKGSVEHDDFCDTLSSGILYLRDRGMLEATPEIVYLDLDEKREKEEQEAVRIHEATRPRVNPYG